MLGSSSHKGRCEERLLGITYVVELKVHVYLGKPDVELVSVAIIVVRLADLERVFLSIIGKGVDGRLRGAGSLARASYIAWGGSSPSGLLCSTYPEGV